MSLIQNKSWMSVLVIGENQQVILFTMKTSSIALAFEILRYVLLKFLH